MCTTYRIKMGMGSVKNNKRFIKCIVRSEKEKKSYECTMQTSPTGVTVTICATDQRRVCLINRGYLK